jgi:L-alanine-DL-glutamate epimerase-like enolase superfamily enzyme
MPDSNPRLAAVEWARLAGRRPRPAGSNARLGPHGDQIHIHLARLTTEDGTTGFGASYIAPAQADRLLGARLGDLFSVAGGPSPAALPLEFALWDLAGQLAGRPVYALAAERCGRALPDTFRARCYDTSLYFDDLGLADEAGAAGLLAEEAREGYARGHRAFKLKIGRGARHLPLEAGTRRDIAVVRAVSAALGPGVPLLLDANNGYNLNLAKRVLAETADCEVFWLEEAFHEDPVLYRDLREWLAARSLPVLIADGEGHASPRLLDMAREGLIDVIQVDVYDLGFHGWLTTGQQLDAWGARSAPHHYGTHYGNYAACHLAGAIYNFAFVEWDEATTPGLEAPGYGVEDGWVRVPDTPGFGLQLDEKVFQRAVEADGFRVQMA